jgi:hypothetical protein
MCIHEVEFRFAGLNNLVFVHSLLEAFQQHLFSCLWEYRILFKIHVFFTLRFARWNKPKAVVRATSDHRAYNSLDHSPYALLCVSLSFCWAAASPLLSIAM